MDRFEKDIQKKLGYYEEAPPLHAWDAIEGRLNSKAASPAVWLRIAAAIVLLMVSAASLWWFLTPTLRQSPILVESPRLSEPTPPEFIPKAPSASIVSDLADRVPQLQQEPTIRTGPDEATSENTYKTNIATSLPAPQKLLGKSLDKQLPLQKIKTQLLAAYRAPEPVTPVFSREETATAMLTTQNTRSSTPGNLALAAHFSPHQSFRYQRSGATVPFEALENEIMGFSAGINISYRIGRRLEIQSGAAWNVMGQQVNDIAAFSHPSMTYLYSTKGERINHHPQSMATSMGGINFTDQSFYFADITSSRILTLKGSYDESNVNLLNKSALGLVQHFGFLEIPFLVYYKLIDKQLSLSVKSGVSGHYLVTDNVYLQGSAFRNPIGQSVGINKLNVAGTGGLALAYPMNSRVDLSLEPTFTMFITPISTINNAKTHPYNYSVRMGLKYKF